MEILELLSDKLKELNSGVGKTSTLNGNVFQIT